MKKKVYIINDQSENWILKHKLLKNAARQNRMNYSESLKKLHDLEFV